MPAIPLTRPSVCLEDSTTRSSASASGAIAGPLSLFGLEFSFETASLDELESVARLVTRIQVGDWFARFGGTAEVALLSTCHRVELVLLLHAPEDLEHWRAAVPGQRDSWTIREGGAMVRHLFRVASGRESLAIGEAEVGHQVRAVGHSIESRYPRPVLRELFEAAADAAEAIGSSAPFRPSIASAAASQLMKILERPDPRVLVVGSGTVGRQLLECLTSSAQLTVVFHQRPPEEPFLRATGARAVHLDHLAEELRSADAVVTAAKFGNHGLRASDLPRGHSIVLIDLGMPRNIDPDVRGLPNVRLIDLEELHGAAGSRRPSDGLEDRVERSAERFSEHLERLLFEPWIDALRRGAEETRRAELANARPYLGELHPGQELALERLTQRLVSRLLAAPTERIRSLPSGEEGKLQRRIALELFRPPADDP